VHALADELNGHVPQQFGKSAEAFADVHAIADRPAIINILFIQILLFQFFELKNRQSKAVGGSKL